jgi:RecB family exonuclease
VQVLDAIEARGLTFEHLFVVGLNRGVFPRVVNEDPLLPDSLRAVLSRHGFGVLQDLPQKLTGYDEERYLFSQLLSAGEEVTLSWQDVDEDNHQQTASPLVERLRWSPGERGESWRQPETARPLYSAAAASRPERSWQHRPAHEAAVLAGIHGDRKHFARVLAVALAEGAAPEVRPPAGLHTARLRILDELDPERGRPRGERTRAELGPYFGFVGPVAPAGDPRSRERVFVTTLENLARCSWRTFLERVLHLRPIPDPLEALPAVEALYVGSLVHGVLERVVLSGLTEGADSFDEARTRSAAPVSWPSPAELGQILREEAAELVRKEGFAFPGFARLLAEVAGPYLETARRLEWRSGDGVRAAAAEIHSALEVADASGKSWEVAFKADRIDRDPNLTVTDYKTGKPHSDKKTEAARHKELLESVRAGERLQAVVYALAAGREGDSGRYVYLQPDPDLDPERRIASVAAGDSDMEEAFLKAARAVLGAWDRGTFLPRLIRARGDREPRPCEWCRVSEACLRGDSGSRGRLREWIDARAEVEPEEPAERSVLEVWRLDAERKSDDRQRRWK